MTTPQAERRLLPSRNPLPLSSAQESQVRDIYYKRVRSHCAKEIRGIKWAIPSFRDSVAEEKYYTYRLCRVRYEPHHICDLGLPHRTPGNEFLHGFLCDARGTRRCEGGMVLYPGWTDTAEGREGEEKEGAGEVSQGVVGPPSLATWWGIRRSIARWKAMIRGYVSQLTSNSDHEWQIAQEYVYRRAPEAVSISGRRKWCFEAFSGVLLFNPHLPMHGMAIRSLALCADPYHCHANQLQCS